MPEDRYINLSVQRTFRRVTGLVHQPFYIICSRKYMLIKK